MFTSVPDALLAAAVDHRRALLDDATHYRLAKLARRATRRRTVRAAVEAARTGLHLPRTA